MLQLFPKGEEETLNLWRGSLSNECPFWRPTRALASSVMEIYASNLAVSCRKSRELHRGPSSCVATDTCFRLTPRLKLQMHLFWDAICWLQMFFVFFQRRWRRMCVARKQFLSDQKSVGTKVTCTNKTRSSGREPWWWVWPGGWVVWLGEWVGLAGWGSGQVGGGSGWVGEVWPGGGF